MEPDFKYLEAKRLKSDPFHPPEGYAKRLTDQVLRRTLEPVPAFDSPALRRTPFRPPEGYFAWLPARILQRLRTLETPDAYTLLTWRGSLTATACVLMVVGGFLWFRQLPAPRPLAAEPARAAQALEAALPSLDEQMLIEALAESPQAPAHQAAAPHQAPLELEAMEELDNEAIQDWLLEQGVTLDEI